MEALPAAVKAPQPHETLGRGSAHTYPRLPRTISCLPSPGDSDRQTLHKSAAGTAEKQDAERGDPPPHRDPAAPEGRGHSPAPRGVPDRWMTDHARKMTTRLRSLQKPPGGSRPCPPQSVHSQLGWAEAKNPCLRRPSSQPSFRNPHLGGRPAQTCRPWPSARGPGPTGSLTPEHGPRPHGTPRKAGEKHSQQTLFPKEVGGQRDR